MAAVIAALAEVKQKLSVLTAHTPPAGWMGFLTPPHARNTTLNDWLEPLQTQQPEAAGTHSETHTALSKKIAEQMLKGQYRKNRRRKGA